MCGVCVWYVCICGIVCVCVWLYAYVVCVYVWFVCMWCVCVCIHEGAYGGHKRAEDPGARVTGTCKSPDVDASNRTGVLWNSTRPLYALTQLSSLTTVLFWVIAPVCLLFMLCDIKLHVWPHH